MANGSRRWFEYGADDAQVYAVELDESNAESNIGGIRLCADVVAGTGLLPSRSKMRYVNTVLTTDLNVRRRFWIGEKVVFDNIVPGDAIADGGDAYTILSKRGEAFTFPNLIDTAQTDGDTPN